jgi:hypothetical protein
MHYWEVWYPRAAATGILVARGRVEPTGQMFFHAASDPIAVEVYDDERKLVARGLNLGATDNTPMCLLTLKGNAVIREDLWPGAEHIGTPVLLPGGEAGILKSWWNAADGSEWRWQVEFYNSRG